MLKRPYASSMGSTWMFASDIACANPASRSNSAVKGVCDGDPEMVPMRVCPRLIRCCVANRAAATSSMVTLGTPAVVNPIIDVGMSKAMRSCNCGSAGGTAMINMPSTRRLRRGATGDRCRELLWSPIQVNSRSMSAVCRTPSTPERTVEKNHRAMYGVTTAMLPVRPEAKRDALGEMT